MCFTMIQANQMADLMRKHRALIAAGATATSGVTLSAMYASKLTTIVSGPTAAPGAIATAKVILPSGQAVILSKVAAPLVTKLIVFGVWTVVSIGVAYMIYEGIKAMDAKAKAKRVPPAVVPNKPAEVANEVPEDLHTILEDLDKQERDEQF